MQQKSRFFSLIALLGILFSGVLFAFVAQAALVVDSSTPARISGSDPRTTVAFNAPNNSLLLAMVSSDAATGSDPIITITNNGTALTWVPIAERSKSDAGANDGEASAFYALLPASRTGMTVTATITNQNQRISLKVYVVTGHDPVNPIGAFGEGSSATNNISAAMYTSTVPGSLGFGVANDWSAAGTPASTDVKDVFHLAGYISGLSAYKAAVTATTGTPVAMNFDAAGTGAVQWNWVGFEVKPNGAPDTTAPVVSMTTPVDGATVFGSAVAVSASASDNISVAGVQFKLDGANLGSEDITSPYSIVWNTAGIANGSHILTAVARDAAGNTATATNITVTVANPPVISNISADSITQTSALISWTTDLASDSQINYGLMSNYGSSTTLDSTLVTSHSQSLSGLNAATIYHYQVLSRDTTGVLAVSSDRTFVTASIPDTTAPAISITTPTDSSIVSGSSVAVSASASDDVGVSGVQFKLDGNNLGSEDTTSPYSITWNTTTAVNGAHVLTALARDAAGNTTLSDAVNVTISNPPIITNVSAGSITANSTTITWTTNVPADSQINYGIDANYGSSTTLDSTLVTSHSQSLSGLASSTTYHYQVASKDANNVLTSSSDATFTTANPPDTTAPTVSMTAPADGATVSGSAVTVSATASDNIGVAGVQFKLDGNNLGSEDTTSPYSITWNTSAVTNGSHVLTAIARDVAGNNATATNITVTVANPPVISSVASSSITTTGATITWTTNIASDSQVDYGTTASYGSSSLLNANLVTAHSVSLGGLSSSTLYHYRVKSKDGNGVLATSSDFTFTTTSTGNALTINGNNKFQTMDGFGVNINSLSWKNGQSKPAIDLLADQMGVNTWRVVFDEEDWETPNDNADPNTMDWTYYNALYSNAKFQNLWGTLGYLNQKGFNGSIALSFMGMAPTWMGNSQTITAANEDEWVEMVASLVYYAKNTAHVNFGILDPINEPLWDGIEGPMVDYPQFTRLFSKLAVKLDSLGLSDVRLMGAENAGGFNSNYVGSLMGNSAVMNKLDHFAFHQYGGDAGGADAYIKSSAYPTKTFWLSEVTDPIAIMNVIGQGPTSVMVWEGFDSVYNHAIRAGRGSTAPNDTSGLANPPVAYNAGSGTYSTRPIFYQDAAIFKYVTPGSTRIGSTESVGNITTYSYYNSTTGRFTITGRNAGSAVNFTATISNVPAISTLQFYRTDTSTLTRLADVAVTNNIFSFSAPANTYFTLTGTANIDTSAPTAPSNLTATGNLGSASLTWQAATDNIGVTAYNVYRSTISGFTASAGNKIGQTTNLAYTDSITPGTYYYLVNAQDAVGNIGPVSNEASAAVLSDTTAPAISITTPTDSSIVSGSSVAVSASASDDVGVSGVQFKLDGNNLGSEDTTSPYSITWNTTTAVNGAHVLTALARDAAGNTTLSDAVNVTVSNPPVISGISVTSITQTSAQVNWTTNVASDSQVNYGLTSAYDSTVLDSTLVTSHSQTISSLTASTLYHYQVASKDANNVLTSSSDATFTTANPPDTTAPTVSMAAPADGATVSGSAVAVSATASDNVGVAGVQFKLDGNNLGSEDTTSPYSITWNSTTVSNGSHTLAAVARDAAGNTTTATSITVTVSNTIASIALIQKVSNITAGASSLAATLPFAATTGNLIVVAASGWPNQGTITVTDSKGNTYARAGNVQTTSGNSFSAIFYAKNIIGGADTITLSNGVAGTQLSMVVSEFSGVDPVSPLDVALSASGSSNAPSTGNMTPTLSGDLVIGAGTHDVSNLTTSAGSGFTMVAIATEDGSSHQPLACEYKIASSTSPLPANFSLSTTAPYAQAGVLFKPASQ